MFVNGGKLLRVLRVGQYEVLNTVVSFSEECHAACGSRLLRLSDTAMDEGLTSGCTNHVLGRLRGSARAGGDGIGFIPGDWQCMVCGADRCWPASPPCYRCAQPHGTLSPSHAGGLPAHVLVLVPGRVPLPADRGGTSPAFPPYLPRGKEHLVPPPPSASQPGPSLWLL